MDLRRMHQLAFVCSCSPVPCLVLICGETGEKPRKDTGMKITIPTEVVWVETGSSSVVGNRRPQGCDPTGAGAGGCPRWGCSSWAGLAAGAGAPGSSRGLTARESSTEGPACAGHMKAFTLRAFSFGSFESLFSVALFKLVFNLLFSL